MKEQEEICGGKDHIGFDEIKSMDYLDACMKETLRLHPPLIFLFRRVLQEFTFEKYRIPKGSLVAAAPIIVHNIPRYWDNPEKFIPERHLGEPSKDADKRYAFIGFGAGRHQCSGETFAYLQIKTILSTLLRSYKLELVGEIAPPNYRTFVVGPTAPVMVRYSRKVD